MKSLMVVNQGEHAQKYKLDEEGIPEYEFRQTFPKIIDYTDNYQNQDLKPLDQLCKAGN